MKWTIKGRKASGRKNGWFCRIEHAEKSMFSQYDGYYFTCNYTKDAGLLSCRPIYNSLWDEKVYSTAEEAQIACEEWVKKAK